MYIFICKCKKSSFFTAIILLSLLVLLFGCQEKEDDSTLMKKKEENSTISNENEKLIVSIFDNEGKSSVVELDAEKIVEEELVTNETVWLHATLSGNKRYLAYTSAKGDGPWEIYLLDRNDKKTHQVTNDTLGQLMPRFGDKEGKTIYSEILGEKYPVSKIAKVDVEKKDSIVFDTEQADRAVEMYDISTNKIIGAFVSEEENKARFKASNETGETLEQIMYSIYEMNLDGSDMKLITSIKAINIDSIAYGPDEKSIILGGENVNEDEGSGIYKLSGIPKNEEVNFNGITTKIQCIYKYDFDNKEITKVYEYKKPAFVTDMTVTY